MCGGGSVQPFTLNCQTRMAWTSGVIGHADDSEYSRIGKPGIPVLNAGRISSPTRDWLWLADQVGRPV